MSLFLRVLKKSLPAVVMVLSLEAAWRTSMTIPEGTLTALESQVTRHWLLLPPVSRVMTLLPVTIIGLIVRLCGDIGAIMMLSSVGERMGPPTLRLYAVDPVAVEMINPSARYVLRKMPSTFTVTVIIP